MQPNRKAIWSAVALLAMGAAACKGDSPSEPSPQTSCATITIANNTVTPKNVTVAPGCQVMFVNNDSVRHEMASDPHPEHTDCPAINSVGVLNPGGSSGSSRQTGNLNTARVCGFHDHERDTVASMRGTITIR